MTTFNLCDEPWIQVRDVSGRVRDVSIREALGDPQSITAIAGEMPTQSVAILRLLLAILYRALPAAASERSAPALWAGWWRDGWPAEAVTSYLDQWRHRFDLRDAEQPFMQVAELTTGSGKRSGLTKIIADLPDGNPFFTQRAGSGRTRLSAAEAARWLVHCQAFDPTGIKTGAVGDNRVKGGRGYPIGLGWAGNLGLVVLEGRTLRETLLLNLDLGIARPDDDLPVWERPQLGPAVEDGHAQPRGVADLFTWPSRRVLLVWHGDEVVDLQISNGDALGPQNRHDEEPMTAWRRSANQEKKLGLATVYMPQLHDPARQVWRGLAPLLDPATAPPGEAPRLRPRTLDWLARLQLDGYVPSGQEVRLRTIGVAYGSNNSVIDAVIDDGLGATVAALSDPSLIAHVKEAVAEADAGVHSLAMLAADLADATNSDRVVARDRAYTEGYATLDTDFRAWFSGLEPHSDLLASRAGWARIVNNRIAQAGATLAQTAGPGAIRGRNTARPGEPARHMDAGKAWMLFLGRLRTQLSLALPLSPEVERTADDGATS
jgi:CRISPR system Cascade subunit CasA